MMERQAPHSQSHNRSWLQVKWLGPLAMIALLLTLMPADACSQRKKDGSDSLIVMVVAQGDFTDREYFETRMVFDQHKATVAVASVAKGFATSHEGVNIKVDIAIGKLDPDQFGAIVIVGGMGAISSLSKSGPLRELLIAAYHQHKLVAAICMAPIVLAKAGLLRNRQATCFSAEPIVNELKRNGAIYRNEEVIEAEGIITANGPNASAAFGEKIIEELKIEFRE